MNYKTEIHCLCNVYKIFALLEETAHLLGREADLPTIARNVGCTTELERDLRSVGCSFHVIQNDLYIHIHDQETWDEIRSKMVQKGLLNRYL